MRTGRTRWAAMAIGVLIHSGANAQEAGSEIAKAWQQAMVPGKPHAMLATLAGDWTYKGQTFTQGPEPTEIKGTAQFTMIMQGRYLQQDAHSSFQGSPWNGRGVTGYDNAAGMYVGTWIDEAATTIATLRGPGDATGYTLYGEFVDPASKKKGKMRWVVRVPDPNHQTFEAYMQMPGTEKEFLAMRLEYERAGL